MPMDGKMMKAGLFEKRRKQIDEEIEKAIGEVKKTMKEGTKKPKKKRKDM